MPVARHVYTPAELKSIRRRVRVILEDGRRLGPKNMQPRKDGLLDAILCDMPEGLVVQVILIDKTPLDIDGMPFTTTGGNLRIAFTPASLGLVPLPTTVLRSVN